MKHKICHTIKYLVLAAIMVGGVTGCKYLPTKKEKAEKADKKLYSQFNWVYGGYNAANAQLSDVNIKLTHLGPKDMNIKWVQDMSVWGYTDGNASAVICVFVKNNGGNWVGGKFEFISSNRKHRSFGNIFTKYGGWSLADVPNPCEFATVVIKSQTDTSVRSNIATGKWQR